MALIERQKAARDFAERWKGKGYEKGESQSFWLSLLAEVLGVGHPTEWISFEQQVHLDHTSFIDACIPRTHVMIEQKSIEKDLGAPVRQSDGSLLNPFQQAKRYAAELRKAHQNNDRAVMAAYGFSPKMTESECVAELFRMYQQLSANIG